MPTVELNDSDWQFILATLADRPWREVNMLVMKIGSQLQAQAHPQPPVRPPTPDELKRMGGIKLDANGKEVHNE